MSITPERELIPRMQVEHMLKLIKRGERIDNRGLLDYRPINIILSPLEKTEGSALVKLGKTQILVGVKLELGTPLKIDQTREFYKYTPSSYHSHHPHSSLVHQMKTLLN